MGSKYALYIVARVLLITALVVVTVLTALQTGWYVTTASAATFTLLAVIELIVWLNRWHRDLNRFLLLLRHRDYSGFNTTHEGIPTDYRASLAAIVTDFRTVRLEKERHYQFLLAVTRHIRTALVCYNSHQHILLANQAMHDLLGVALLNELRQVTRVCPDLTHVITSYSGDSAVSIVIRGTLHRLSVHRTLLVLDKEEVTIVSLREIGLELDSNEQEAWQKLFQVLTHEIMNSVTPIASLSQAARDLLNSPQTVSGQDAVIRADDFADLAASVAAINERSNGLLRFVAAYKNLTAMPQPRFEQVAVADLVRYVSNLLGNTFAEKALTFHSSVFPADLVMLADREMMQRLLLNLLLNAMYATEGVAGSKVELTALLNPSERVSITIADNGKGISPEHLDKIFVPFFTTRQGGSGLGLSISREIVRLHRGHIRVKSTPGEGAVFEVIV